MITACSLGILETWVLPVGAADSLQPTPNMEFRTVYGYPAALLKRRHGIFFMVVG